MAEKELLKKLGIETLYSAKGHFKSCDLRRNLVTITLWLCAVLNVVGLIGVSPTIDKWLAAVGLFGTIALLMWNEGEGKDYKNKHKQTGEEYLALHKEIRSCYFITDCSNDKVQELNSKVIEFDKKNKPEIPFMARKLAQKAIEKHDETDNWFLNK
jgi:hypothetical protein